MARRSDHTREELRTMIVHEGHRQISEVGFARFSAREVAKRIGYSIGTIYNVFGSHDMLIIAINARTLALWQAHVEARLAGVAHDRLRVLVEAYFEFALLHRHAWTALYDHRLPDDVAAPDYYLDQIRALTGIVQGEIAAALPSEHRDQADALARSLLATVHGHCFFTLNGTFALLGETTPLETVYARVREAIGTRHFTIK
ncbi:TetR/AcrR family transcriptional regulator [Sphingomonas sp. HF-S4]|uniref:TetR/AcrR family transcriptional regulator n=1 Tax=Sphingomonas agrestis TaxID=3080540 RepID=A0ABU3Y4F3_9SPHN|nr:TetR/AcrR family transcriptional regulator [Sphingomonas sp. HF-S4]MDV3456223.1 TetR/AcrR family transcriptional regulator [Sphingomonas sp. HF-S4]